MAFESIRDQMTNCVQPVPVNFKTRATALYVQVDAAGSQLAPALAELDAAYDSAIATVTECLATAQAALEGAVTTAQAAIPADGSPAAALAQRNLDTDEKLTQRALESAAAGASDDVTAIRDRTRRMLRFKIRAVLWRRRRGAWVLAILFILMALASFFLPTVWGAILWLINLALLVAAVSVIGLAVSGVWWGVLVDVRNMLSLSRLQLVVWTILILSAFLTIALTNVSWIVFQRPNPLVDPLGIAVPQEIWALMGISAASLAGSTLIKSNKASSVADGGLDKSGMANVAAQRSAPGTTVQQGQLVGNESIVDASVADIFRGEEVGNADNVDLGKVQMFAFTFILVIAYGFAVDSVLQGGLGRIIQFPDLSPSMVTLLAISHAGYLTLKAAPHTGTAPTIVTTDGA